MKRWPFPVWLQRLTSWANARVNYGPRLHVDCRMHGCLPCAVWRDHDESFNDDSPWILTKCQDEGGRCAHPIMSHNDLGCAVPICECWTPFNRHARPRPPRPRVVRA